MMTSLKPDKGEARRLLAAWAVVAVALCVVLMLSGCASVGLSPEDKTKVVDAALEPGKTAWCVDVAIIDPICLMKEKSKPE